MRWKRYIFGALLWAGFIPQNIGLRMHYLCYATPNEQSTPNSGMCYRRLHPAQPSHESQIHGKRLMALRAPPATTGWHRPRPSVLYVRFVRSREPEPTVSEISHDTFDSSTPRHALGSRILGLDCHKRTPADLAHGDPGSSFLIWHHLTCTVHIVRRSLLTACLHVLQ